MAPISDSVLISFPFSLFSRLLLTFLVLWLLMLAVLILNAFTVHERQKRNTEKSKEKTE